MCRGLHACAQVCTCFIADFIVCDMRVKQVSHMCGIKHLANLYRIILLMRASIAQVWLLSISTVIRM